MHGLVSGLVIVVGWFRCGMVCNLTKTMRFIVRIWFIYLFDYLHGREEHIKWQRFIMRTSRPSVDTHKSRNLYVIFVNRMFLHNFKCSNRQIWRSNFDPCWPQPFRNSKGIEKSGCRNFFGPSLYLRRMSLLIVIFFETGTVVWYILLLFICVQRNYIYATLYL